MFPAVVINNVTYRGQLEIEQVYNAICAGFYHEPDYCKRYLDTNDINDVSLILMERPHKPEFVAKVITFIMFVFVIAMCFYRRYAKRDMKRQIDQQIESAVN